MINESKYSAASYLCKKSPFNDLQSKSSELGYNSEVRKSQRTPKKKTIKSYGFTAEEGPTRKRQIKMKKQADIRKRSSGKTNIISQSREKSEEMTSFVLEKVPYHPVRKVIKREEPQESHYTEKICEDLSIHLKNQIETKNQSHRLKSNVPIKRKSKTERRPDNKIRYDKMKHFPDSRKFSTTRCKMEGCRSKSAIFCIKCKVHLCVKMGRNCFRKFHTLDIDPETNVQ